MMMIKCFFTLNIYDDEIINVFKSWAYYLVGYFSFSWFGWMICSLLLFFDSLSVERGKHKRFSLNWNYQKESQFLSKDIWGVHQLRRTLKESMKLAGVMLPKISSIVCTKIIFIFERCFYIFYSSRVALSDLYLCLLVIFICVYCVQFSFIWLDCG